MRREIVSNPIAEEILSYYGVAESRDDLSHYGMPRRSGRYPWGSGKDPYQHAMDFLGRVDVLKKNGFKETAEEVEREFGMTLDEYRKEKTACRYDRQSYEVAQIKSMKSDGLSTSEIGRRMGKNESTIRSMLDVDTECRRNAAREAAMTLKKLVDEKGMIDVGKNVHYELGITATKLEDALYYLQTREGYEVYTGGVRQPTNPSQQTIQKVLCPPGTPHKDIYQYDKISTVTDWASNDGGETFRKFQYPASIDGKRVMARYAEEGGLARDGLIEIRRGVPDLDLGNDKYAQIRMLMDKTHYLKGMAVYSDGPFPDGVDVIFNTNKKVGSDKDTVFKKIHTEDPNNPFGSLIKANGQSDYIDPVTGEKKLSLINKRASEGDWSDWSNGLPSQFLGKQSLPLAKQQLDLAKKIKHDEFNEIMSLENPTIKKYYLKKFADECDSAAVDLKAAALPGQKYHVIIPVNTLKDTEVFAPNYPDGTKLALVRYPHGGIFEIPILTVNNKNRLARSFIGADSPDAVGITSKVAEQLSGADFDGDTVMCIPTHDPKGRVKIANKEPLEELKGFDSKMYKFDKTTTDEDGTIHYFRGGKEFNVMKETNKQMGVISNLITDMTIGGAPDDQLARAVKHSMVVIDAEKHKLDYKQSEADNNIKALKEQWQRKIDPETGEIKVGGASTLLSRSKGEYRVDKRQGSAKTNTPGKPWYDPSKPDGALIYNTTKDLYYIDRHGKQQKRTDTSTNMAETDDARTLISAYDHPMERLYADYANEMKALANKSRLEIVKTKGNPVSKDAKKEYEQEVKDLNAKIAKASLNSIKERQAARKANARVKEITDADPEYYKTKKGKEALRKSRQQAMTEERANLGGKSRKDRYIKITDREWEAIQKGAISENKLNSILNNTDPDDLRERSMPRERTTVSPAKQARIQAYQRSNYTIEEIAKQLNLSTSTVEKYLK